jgi:hypothetical protein
MVRLCRRAGRLAVVAAACLAPLDAAGWSWARPRQVAALPSGEAVVMLADGRLVMFDTRAPRPQWSEVHRLRDLSLQPVDVELTLVNGKPTAFILLYRDAMQSFLWRVGLKGGASDLCPALPLGRGPAVGLAIRPGSTEAIITSLSDRSVYRLDLADSRPEPRFLFSPVGMRPGVIAWRSSHPEIVLGDGDSDTLYLARFPDGAQSPLHKVDGLIRSVVLDPSGHFAYVAEGRHGAVWRIDLDNAAVSPKEMVPHGIVRDAVDLAVDGSGRVWIVDGLGDALFVLDPIGGPPRRVFQW